jgi:hypothetical protein
LYYSGFIFILIHFSFFFWTKWPKCRTFSKPGFHFYSFFGRLDEEGQTGFSFLRQTGRISCIVFISVVCLCWWTECLWGVLQGLHFCSLNRQVFKQRMPVIMVTFLHFYLNSWKCAHSYKFYFPVFFKCSFTFIFLWS